MAASYSPALHRSTIGATGLNFSVRNGKRWDPGAIAALNFLRNRSNFERGKQNCAATRPKTTPYGVESLGQLVALGCDVTVYTPAPYQRPRLGRPLWGALISPGQRSRYMNKVSGPLLDRIDIQCEITPVPFKDISKAQPGEPSAAIRERVIKARDIQTARYKDFKGVHCNAQMTERMIHQFAEPDEASIALLRTAMEKFSLSARAYNRILKVARTIADLDASDSVQQHHLAEAIGYRNLDRGDWAER